MSASSGLFVNFNNGYVGIGTTNPRTQLNLTSSGSGNDATVLTVGGGGTSASLGLDFAPDSSRSGGAAAGIRAVGDGAGNAHLTLSTTTGGAATSLVERVRVLSDGNVGIGTTNPQATLHVQGTLYSPGLVVQNQYFSLFRTTSLNPTGETLTSTPVVVTITPKFSTSKMRVRLNTQMTAVSAGNLFISLYRKIGSGSYVELTTTSYKWGYLQSLPGYVYWPVHLTYMDTPNTTLSTEYRIYIAGNTSAVFIHPNSSAYIEVDEITT